MSPGDLTSNDFQQVLSDISSRFPALKIDDLFVMWFLRTYVTESEDRAAQAVAGGARDKGIDGVLIDDGARAIIIVQGNYHKALGETLEKRADVISLAEVALRLSDTDDPKFQSYLTKMDGLVAGHLRDARKRILQQNYRIWLYFVTLGKVSETIRKDAESHLNSVHSDARLEIIDSARAKVLLRDYLDGVAPPIPALDLEMEDGDQVRVNGVSQRYDDKNKIESWVFSMRGDKVAALFDYAGRRLFARNIRGFLGRETAVNRGMAKTLQKEPDRFFYYNNGITILCDEAIRKGQQGHDFLHVRNPQVINGQQTTRTLAEHPELAAKASVLVKVIRVAQRLSDDSHFDRLLSQIVAGTNWQNAIRPSDLMANDRVQIELERALRKMGYGYIRKKQTKDEAKRETGGKHYFFVKKEEFAQAVAACELDPVIARTRKEKLFEEPIYARLFRSNDPFFYLARYWLMRRVRYLVSTKDRRHEARWVVINLVWSEVSSFLKGSTKARAFSEQCQRQDRDLMVPLDRAINTGFAVAMKFYTLNKGKGADLVNLATFFKSKRASAKQFVEFWKTCKDQRVSFDRRVAAAIEAIGV